MKTIATLLLCTSLLTMGCDDDSEINRDSIEFFRQHLDADMNFKNLKATFGKPDEDIGSGIHIYVYNLEDGTKVQIGYTDKILYAFHRDENDQLLEALIN